MINYLQDLVLRTPLSRQMNGDQWFPISSDKHNEKIQEGVIYTGDVGFMSLPHFDDVTVAF